MVDVELGFCQTNHAFACDWSFDCRVVVGKRRWRRVDPQPLDQFTGGWKFFFFQCICIGHRGFYVFRHAHRNPDPAGAHSFRHGKRPCIGTFAGGPIAFPAQYAGDKKCIGKSKNHNICNTGGGNGHSHRFDLRFHVVNNKPDLKLKTMKTPIDLLKEFAPEFAQHQMDEKVLLFEHEKYQAVPKKYKLLAGIALAAVLNSDTCTRMWVKQAKAEGITNQEIAEAIMVARYMKQATVNDTVANTFQLLSENKL